MASTRRLAAIGENSPGAKRWEEATLCDGLACTWAQTSLCCAS
jgi:hypothetical protein